MPEQITSSADLWVSVEADITGADSSKTAASSVTRSSQPSLMVGTYNASLPTVSDGTGGALQIDSSGRLIVGSVASLALPAGASTSALQTTGNGFLSTLAGAVAGSEIQVDVISAPTITIADGGGSITVDGGVNATQQGAWTVDLGATDNGVLDAIAASLAGTLAVSLATLPALATGANAIGSITNTAFGVTLPTLGTFTNRSTNTGATPNTWVQAAAANAGRTRFFLNLPSTAANPVLVGFGASASEVIVAQVQPGGSFTIEEGHLPCDAQRISIQSAGVSVAVYAHEYARA